MSLCNPSHPNCLKKSASSGIRFCAGCGRSSDEVALEVSSSEVLTTASSVEAVLVQELDVVSEDIGDTESLSAESIDTDTSQLDDAIFTDSLSDEGDVSEDDDYPIQTGAVIGVDVTGMQVDGDSGIGSSNDTTLLMPAALGGGAVSVAPTNLSSTTASVSLQSALTELQAWATKWNCRADPYVVGLSNAISQRDDLTMWASLSPREYLPQPVLSTRSGIIETVSRLLTLVRNVLVFIPVAITWFAIGKASEAYGLFTADNPNTP